MFAALFLSSVAAVSFLGMAAAGFWIVSSTSFFVINVFCPSVSLKVLTYNSLSFFTLLYVANGFFAILDVHIVLCHFSPPLHHLLVAANFGVNSL